MKAQLARDRNSHAAAKNKPPLDTGAIVAMFNAGRHADVEAAARTLLRHHPHSGFLWKALGAALVLQGKDALHALRQATVLLPNEAEAHNTLGAALRDSGKPDAALKSYQRALTLKPGYADACNNRGIALLDLGRAQDAAASFRRALQIQPQHIQAHNNLGNALSILGQTEAAVASYRHALTLAPQYVEAYNNLGKALYTLGRLDEAHASYRRALEIKPDYVEALANIAIVLCDLGQPDAAISSCCEALSIKPNHAEAHCNLAAAFGVLCDLRQLGEAAASCQRAIDANPRLVEAHVNLGRVRRLQGYTADAEVCCRAALAINPDLSGALLFLAELLTDQGEFVEAERIYHRIVEIDSSAAEAWAGIAHVRKMTAQDMDWVEGALRLIAQGLPPRGEIFLRYSLGKYFNDVKDFDQAFLHYRRANELSKLHGRAYDREQKERAVESATRLHGREWFAQSRVGANFSERPVFIVGMPRSGTSLVEQILSSHPSVHGAGELPFWRAAAATCEKDLFMSEDIDAVMPKLARGYLAALDECSHEAKRVTDKMPSNVFHLGLILAAFPNARIIHMQRNPIDICLSIYFQNFNAGHTYANDLEDIAHYYGCYHRLMKHWRAVLPAGTLLDVPYEELVRDQEGWSRRMIDFIGLPWNARCMDFHECRRAVSTASNWQVRQKMDNSSVARWRNYQTHVGPLLGLLESNEQDGREVVAPATQLLGDIVSRAERRTAVLTPMFLGETDLLGYVRTDPPSQALR